MKINEIVKEPQSRKPSRDESEVGLIQFREDDDCDQWLKDLSHDLLNAESVVQVRMILMIHLEDKLEGVRWGGTEV